jgi:hypothetical protein
MEPTDYSLRHRDCYNADGTPKRRFLERRHVLEHRKKYSNSKNMRPYLCAYCGFWHLGHNWAMKRKESKLLW